MLKARVLAGVPNREDAVGEQLLNRLYKRTVAMFDGLDVWLTVATGLLLRFGIPVMLTGLLIGLLRWLDHRWRTEGEAQRPLAAAVQQQPSCWEIRNCPAEMRAQCPVYRNNHLPCWQVMRATTGRLPERCLDCPVFRNAPVVGQFPQGAGQISYSAVRFGKPQPKDFTAERIDASRAEKIWKKLCALRVLGG